MKNFLSALALASACASLAGGCASPDSTAPHEESVLKKSMDRGSDIETDSNINQINQALMMIKQDGGAPTNLEDAKRVVKMPDEMWFDKVANKPLVYDAASGTVHREGVAPGAPPAAGSPHAPGGINIPNAGGY